MISGLGLTWSLGYQRDRLVEHGGLCLSCGLEYGDSLIFFIFIITALTSVRRYIEILVCISLTGSNLSTFLCTCWPFVYFV